MGVARLDRRDPDRQPVRAHHRLDVAAEAMYLSRVPQVDGLALTADRGAGHPIGFDDLAVQDHERPALLVYPIQGLDQFRGLRASRYMVTSR